ncbi:putative cytochrome P450 alkane hydroxylase [Aspergillus pseudodeflectus]|uniref:Cytochrome P450 alkane hydroxylase n=1 Tax=Aspergillus pseudodeflectus TaxID=176178 RepID=A0ABR4JZ91_9EURO
MVELDWLAIRPRLVLYAILLFSAVRFYVQRRRQQVSHECLGRQTLWQHGCQPINSKLPYEWPLGLDILKKQYDALMRGNLFAYQRTRLLGRVGYFTMDPKNLEAMLQTRFDDWELGSSRDAVLPMIGNGIFTQDGHAWKHSREILRRQFVRMQYQDMTIFETPVETMLGRLQDCTGVVDLQPVFFRFTLATTISLIFGELSADIKQSDNDTFEEAFDYTSLISAMRMRLAEFCWLYNPSKYRRSCNVLREYASRFVHHALEGVKANGEEMAEKRHPFTVDLLRELKDPKLVRDQLMNVLIAGRDTTACLMSWACYHLVRNPAALERLREEIASIAPKGERLTRPHISKMAYLQRVLKETNRLYTQVPVNVRVARKTTYLPRGGGPDGESPILIPKNTGVGFSAYHMHRNKEIYGDNANEFRPERWEGSQSKNLGFAFMPFHDGPRVCLGKDFALMEASYGLVRLLQEFPNLRIVPDVAQTTPGLEKQNLTIVLSSAEGCKVLLR